MQSAQYQCSQTHESRCPTSLLWAELCLSKPIYGEVLTPSTQECDLIWRIFNEIKIKSLGLALIQCDRTVCMCACAYTYAWGGWIPEQVSARPAQLASF